MSRAADRPAPRRAEAANRRLDQWLWFARLVKSRSLAARLVAEGCVALNGALAGKANRPVAIGDEIEFALGRCRRRVQVLDLGARRGPAREARLLYREIVPPARLPRVPPGWVPLLADDAEKAAQ